MKKPVKIAVFASGSGSNAENLVQHFKRNADARVSMIVCNKPKAGVVSRAHKLRVPLVLISSRSLDKPSLLLETLQKEDIELIVLAGFLKLIPEEIIEAFPNKILNVHPALLPKFGGKGMYGKNVHKAVIDSNESVSGITIHLVNSKYDEGQILEQFEVALEEKDGIEEVEKKVRALEIEHFPRVVEDYVQLMFS